MNKLKPLTPFAVMAVSVAFVFLGVNRGEVAVMFEKAIAICLECIGIG